MPSRLQLASLLTPDAVCHFSTVIRPTGAAKHTHDFVEIYWVVSGRGTEELQDSTISLGRSSIGLVRHDDVHRFASTDSLTFRNLAFTRGHWRRLLGRYSRMSDMFEKPKRRLFLSADALAAVEYAASDLLAGKRDALAH